MDRHSPASYLRAARLFRKQRYLAVKRLLPPAILEYLKVYYGVLAENGRFSADEQCPASLSLGGDPGLDAMLELVRPEISRLVGVEVASTYSYTRTYAKGERLSRHRDRAACEISVTTSIVIPGGAGPSTIYLKPPGGEAVKVEMREGDACIYAGTEVEHWRERFRVGGYTQLFLHFISKTGPHYPDLIFDGRTSLGADYSSEKSA